MAAVSTLFLGALVTEREGAIRRAEEARADAVEAQYAERQRIERDLHDGLQQQLLGLRMQLLRTGTADAAQRLEIVSDVDRGLSEALEEVRAVAQGTYPPVLTEVGLGGALDEIAARSTIPVIVEQAPSGDLGPAVEALAYFVIAESVSNAQKHARASTVRVRVASTGDELHIVVADDGIGGASEDRGSGLTGLRSRVESFGGSFRVVSPVDRGTAVSGTVPLHRSSR